MNNIFKYVKVTLIISSIIFSSYCSYDLTIIGPIRFAESISGLSAGVIDCLKDDIKINFVPTNSTINFDDLPNDVQNVVKNPDKTPGKVILFTDILWHTTQTPSNLVPNISNGIKIAYSMIESTLIPPKWVQILNSKFDAVVVPDQFLVKAYEDSGVKIPIFVIPCGIYLDDLLNKQIKDNPGNPFTFGMSALASQHKNFGLLTEAFIREFYNDPNVRLVLHDRTSNFDFLNRIKNRIQALKVQNISIIAKRFSRSEYIEFLSTIDCYTLISKGEGFSITPREALALGIPCILSDNTAHHTICNTNLVKSVNTHIKERAYYVHLNGAYGFYFNCTIEDVRKALREVYNNYQFYLRKAHLGREWVKQYLYSNLRMKYLNLIKPIKIELGNENSISDAGIITNSPGLYKKYLAL